MKRNCLFFGLVLTLVLSIGTAYAESHTMARMGNIPVMHENTDGNIQPGEYERISPNGAVTRRPCPYTCPMHNVPSNHCREWRSKDGDLCYVWDTRLPQSAIEIK